MSFRERNSHFEFGANWRDYAKSIDQTRIASAIDGLKKLLPEGLGGKTFLDIGCGSGLHSLAALSLGSSSVLAIDIDENSVSTTREVLSKFSHSKSWKANVLSIFDAKRDEIGTFDVVYSWGVLHHTGAMWNAIERAAALVKADGYFAIAIYAKTAFDLPWKIEKRIYKSLPAPGQWALRNSFIGVLLAGKLLRGKHPMTLLKSDLPRGMNLSNDVHDWLGGYPYETATVEELVSKFSSFGFSLARSFPANVSLGGLLGSGCHELVFHKTAINRS
ncbi:class I SAM-dependent methyltransferase [Bradyrhizobium erythrophlei]|uniref:class I SAM-dependent methyltransferase n=1 Tax=Bradyrhizobium erythrophlei TaxID=1437360 RepID=UPI0035EC0425